MSASPFDICKCGDARYEHDEIGPREFFRRSTCTEFRLCVTAMEMQESYDACIADLRSRE